MPIITSQNRNHLQKLVVDAPDGHVLTIKPATRSLDQNAKMHALFADIARQAKHMGRTMTAQQWKTLFISGHAVATGLGADMVPGLEGEYCNVRESSASMSIARMSSVIEYTTAWAVQNGVKLSADPRQYDERMAA